MTLEALRRVLLDAALVVLLGAAVLVLKQRLTTTAVQGCSAPEPSKSSKLNCSEPVYRSLMALAPAEGCNASLTAPRHIMASQVGRSQVVWPPP